LRSGRRRGSEKGKPRTRGFPLVGPSGKPNYADWVWWPNQKGRRSRAEEEFFSELPPKAQAEMLARIQRLLTGETRFKDVDDLGDGIKELRYRDGSNHYRVLFFIDGTVCVGLTCFYKNQQKTEKTDLDRAKRRRDSY
jgi:phage-related protein